MEFVLKISGDEVEKLLQEFLEKTFPNFRVQDIYSDGYCRSYKATLTNEKEEEPSPEPEAPPSAAEVGDVL